MMLKMASLFDGIAGFPLASIRNGIERNVVAQEVKTFAQQRSDEYKESDVACTQAARQYKDSTDLVTNSMRVRRLTPKECERLQGFPDGWTDISEAKGKYSFWETVHEAYRIILGKSKKPYTRNFILKWMNKKADDSARYKSLGNSVAMPCVMFIMEGIARVLNS